MASCALLLKTNPTTLPPCFFENTKSYKTIKEFRCYEVKIEESEKAGGFRSRTQDTLAWAASDLLLSYGNRTTTNPHNPLYVLHKWSLGGFAFLYFHLIISKFLYFQHEARCSEHFWVLCSLIPCPFEEQSRKQCYALYQPLQSRTLVRHDPTVTTHLFCS